jgi:hypothetical protein
LRRFFARLAALARADHRCMQAAPNSLLPPALVVVSGGAQPVRPVQPDLPDPRLLQALPRARRVLEVGAGRQGLALSYKRQQADAVWCAVNLFDAAMPRPAPAPGGVDHWLPISALDTPDALAAAGPELIVISDVLPWLDNPLRRLRALRAAAAPDTRLMIRVENHASLDVLQHLAQADLSSEQPWVAQAGPPRLMSPASIYKLLMDAGWMPHLADATAAKAPEPAVAQAVLALNQALRLAGSAPQHVQQLSQLVIEARATFAVPEDAAESARFDVLVPGNEERQLRANVEASPGLREVGARVITYRGARSAAEAFEQGRQQVQADWVLLCHQDIYFPAGFGRLLNAELCRIPPSERARTLLGFVGMGAPGQGQGFAPAGFVIDRLHRVDHPASNSAVSIDELAIVLSRDSLHRIDPALGWHLWATDLCLTAICQHRVLPRVLRLPLFHNSRTGWQLPEAFHASAATLLSKWPDHGPIPTLCGVIDEAFVRAHARPQPQVAA